MLQRLLNLLASGKPQTVSSLAATLNMPEAIIHQMTRQLVQLGYLQESGTCSEPPAEVSSHCSDCSGCLLVGPQHIWALTEKGLRAANAA